MDDKERRKLGNNLVLGGILLFITILILYPVVMFFWYEFRISLWIGVALCITGLVFTITGGVFRENSINDWLVHSGLLLILTSLLMIMISIVGSGIFLDFSWIGILILISGFGIAVVGGFRSDN